MVVAIYLVRIKRTEDKAEASVFVLNTCSIRDHAEQKVYSYVGPYAIRKQKGENLAIVVAGYVTRAEGFLLLFARRWRALFRD